MIKKRKSYKVQSPLAGCLMPLVIAVLAFLLFVSSLYLFPQFKASLGLKDLPTSFDDMRADKIMGYKTVEIQNSVLSEAKRVQRLVVREQTVSVDVELSQMLWNIPLFEKTKVMHAYGTGVFGYDLSNVQGDIVSVNHNTLEVVVELGEPALLYVEPDHSKTTFEATEHALLAFGDIRLTAEQMTVVNQDIVEGMKNALSEVPAEELLQDGRLAAERLFGPLILEIVPGYSIAFR